MYGNKLLWTGLTLIMSSNLFSSNVLSVAGAIIMIIGLILFLLDR